MIRKILVFSTYAVLSALSYVVSLWIPDVTTVNIFHSIVALAALYGLFVLVVEELLVRKISDGKTRYSLRKTVSLLMLVLLLVIWLRIWVPDPQALLVAYGVIAAGLAVALQDVVKNLAGSITVFLTGVYRVGNRIEIDGNYGDVIDIGLFNTTLLEVREWIDADQATGRIISVPNGVVLRQPVQNFTKHHSFLWDELSVVVTSESDWQKAMQIMSEIAEKHTSDFIEKADRSLTRLERYYYVEGHVLKPNVYVKPATDGYQLTLRYVVDAWQRRSTHSDIWSEIISTFTKHDDIFIAPHTISSMEYPLPPSKGKKR